MSKKSIRFFNDREVRAVWDEENSNWWFSATDIVRAINDEEDYKKCRNYWKYLKGKMAKDGVQLVSVTNHFKFEAPDGKQRAVEDVCLLEQDRQERLSGCYDCESHG
jgi:cell filamentation protein